MAPRNNDASTSYKKKNFPIDDSEADIKNIVPCLLHKKHKVVKLVKCQIRQIQEEGLLCNGSGFDCVDDINDETEINRTGRRRRQVGEADLNDAQENKGFFQCLYLLTFLLALFLFILLIVWISAGPLSNSIAHTPVPCGSFIRTEGLCSLEKKYLLRWSKPEYFE